MEAKNIYYSSSTEMSSHKNHRFGLVNNHFKCISLPMDITYHLSPVISLQQHTQQFMDDENAWESLHSMSTSLPQPRMCTTHLHKTIGVNMFNQIHIPTLNAINIQHGIFYGGIVTRQVQRIIHSFDYQPICSRWDATENSFGWFQFNRNRHGHFSLW